MEKQEREFIQADEKGMWMLKRLLGIKKNKCHYCKKKIKKGDKFSIFNKPTRLICNSLLCLTEAMDEDEEVTSNKGEAKKNSSEGKE